MGSANTSDLPAENSVQQPKISKRQFKPIFEETSLEISKHM